MVEIENEIVVEAPLEAVWNWTQNVGNLFSIGPLQDLAAETGGRKASVKINPRKMLGDREDIPLDFLPEKIETSIELIDTNESDKSSRSKIVGKRTIGAGDSTSTQKLFVAEGTLSLEPEAENRTRISFGIEAQEEGILGQLMGGGLTEGDQSLGMNILGEFADRIMDNLKRELEKLGPSQ